MLNFFSRLDKFMDFKKLSDNKITIACKISNGLIGKARNRGSLSQLNISKILLNYPELNPDWLLTNRGTMIRNIKEKKVQKVSENNEFEQFQNFSFAADEKNEKSNISNVEIQLQHLLKPKIQDVDVVVKISDDTMFPVFSKNDIVLAKKLEVKNVIFQWNNLYLINTQNDVFVKRVVQAPADDMIILTSENSFYAPIELEISKIKSIFIIREAIRFLS